MAGSANGSMNMEQSEPQLEVKQQRRTRPKKDESKIVDIYNDMMFDLVQKDYVLFAPKSDRGLKYDYPELDDKDRSPEFVGIGKYDMLFIWAWGCASSPFVSMDPREDKLRLCTAYAYPPEQVDRKIREYTIRFSEDVNRGIEKMFRYNKEARVEEYVAIKVARENYKHMLAKDISKATPYEQKEWAELSIIAQKGLAAQRDRVEGFGLGIEESQNTRIQQAVDVLSMHHMDHA